MMKNEIEITGFRLYRIGNSELRKKNIVPRTEKDLINEGLEGIPATVPGCVERDLAAAGLFPADVAYGDNILRCRELERTHFYYATSFDIGDGGVYRSDEFYDRCDADGINHFVTCLNTTVSFEKYREFMKNSGFDSALEGF